MDLEGLNSALDEDFPTEDIRETNDFADFLRIETLAGTLSKENSEGCLEHIRKETKKRAKSLKRPILRGEWNYLRKTWKKRKKQS